MLDNLPARGPKFAPENSLDTERKRTRFVQAGEARLNFLARALAKPSSLTVREQFDAARSLGAFSPSMIDALRRRWERGCDER